jgi:hypothetical protein
MAIVTFSGSVRAPSRLTISHDIYRPLENEYAAADYCRPGDRVLDLSCGSGPPALYSPEVREGRAAVGHLRSPICKSAGGQRFTYSARSAASSRRRLSIETAVGVDVVLEIFITQYNPQLTGNTRAAIVRMAALTAGSTHGASWLTQLRCHGHAC